MKIKGRNKLLLDTSSFIIQLGILNGNEWVGYFRSEDPALQSIFRGVEVCLEMSGLELKDITDFVYCEGPGSLLGIRLAAMAIRGWRAQEAFRNASVYAYNSFEFALALIKKIYAPKGPYAIVSESRKGYWNIVMSGEGKRNFEVFELEEIELASFSAEMWLFKQKKTSVNERDLRMMSFDYNLKEYPEIFAEESLLRAEAEPDALFVREPEYVKWNSRRHMMEDRK